MTNRLTNAQLADLKDKADKATPGQWKVRTTYGDGRALYAGDSLVMSLNTGLAKPPNPHDEAFMMACRAAVPVLIAEVQASRAQRLQAADLVLFNDGLSLDQLRSEVLQVARHFGL